MSGCDAEALENNERLRMHVCDYPIGTEIENWCVISDVSQLQSALFSIASNVLELDM